MNFHSKVAVVNSNGDHLRSVPSALAAALVSAGHASPVGAGRVRSVTLSRPASSFAERIGDAKQEGGVSGIKFWRYAYLSESGARVFEHHPRCTYISPDDD